jgi:hypothetical protein
MKLKNANSVIEYMKGCDSFLVRDLNKNEHYVINYSKDSKQHNISEDLFMECFNIDGFEKAEFESDDNVFEFRYYGE